ncbi:MAG TPA: dihydroorotase [Terriglobales bacterium]|nr:dihydroorotase [Terriglobales bacterium]
MTRTSGPMGTRPLLISGGTLITETGEMQKADLLIDDGRITSIDQAGKIPERGQTVLEARRLLVSPGFIDLHVHLREPGQSHKETIATGTAAAAAGGFTAVCTMPNTTPVNDSPEITRWMQKPERGAVVKVHPIAAATMGSNGERLTNFKALVEAGAVAVTDDGRPILGNAIMREALQAAHELGIPVIQHAEDTRMTQGCSMHDGPTSFRLGLRGVKPEAEASIVARDIELASETKAHLHVAHLSTAAALEQVRKARKRGVHVTCEVTPHHLLLTDEEVGDYDTNCKMNPPLRDESDRQAMWEGLHDGSIDCIATDHAPHAAHEKDQEFDRAPFGITGLETALPIALMVAGGDPQLAVRWLSSNPASVMGWKEAGVLRVGAPANIVVFDPAEEWTFTAKESKSKSKNSPFIGKRLRGRVQYTIVDGRVVWSL